MNTITIKITPRSGRVSTKEHLLPEIARHANARLLPSYPSRAKALKAAEREWYAECASRELYAGCQAAFWTTLSTGI